jgi:tetratricopeptide (TPR) repeat protein/TolB-like protein
VIYHNVTISSRATPTCSNQWSSTEPTLDVPVNPGYASCEFNQGELVVDEVLEHLRTALPDRYTIEREIGRGGMATVYLATEDHPHREVALKVLSPEVATHVMRERFLREIDVISKLIHPHIVPVYAAGDADGLLYYVMPYIKCESLGHRLARGEKLPVPLALRIAQEVAGALHYAHEAGVVHRDIKPANILLQDDHALVADFGIARAVGDAGGQQLTQAGLAMGTPAYMSPEQWSASGDIDGRSDLYSLGCVLLEALGGDPAGISPAERISSVSKAVRTAAGADRTTGGLTNALERALALNPGERFHTAAAFAEALNRSDPGRVTVEVGAKKHRPTKGGLLVMMAIVVGAVIVGTMLPSGGPSDDAGPPRVVVAAFENQTGDATLAPIGPMTADWITQGLSQTGLVEVLGNLSAMASSAEAGTGAPGSESVQMLANQSGADVVISGRYYKQGSNIQFQGQITDAHDQTLISAIDPVLVPVDSPLVAVEELRQRVMGALALRFDERLSSWALASNQPPSYDGYREYMEGMSIFMQQLNGEAAVPHLLRAAELDTNFVTPLLFAAFASASGGGWELADSLGQVVDAKRDRLIPLEAFTLDWVIGMTHGDYPAALAGMRQAVIIAPSSEMYTLVAITALAMNRPREALDALDQIDPESGLMRGFFMHWTNITTALHLLGEHRRELAEARRGLELYPGNPFMTVNMTRAFVALGRLDEAVEALGDQPSPPPTHWVAAGEDALITALEMTAHGHPEEAYAIRTWAIDWFETLEPETLAEPLYRYGYARLLYFQERWQQAADLFQALAEEQPDSVSFRGYLGSTAARMGDREMAMQISDSLAALDGPFRFGAVPYWQARIAAVLGDRELAVSKLRRALDEGFQVSDAFHRDGDLIMLRGYEPFDELLRPKD